MTAPLPHTHQQHIALTLALLTEDNIDALLDLPLKAGQEAFVASVAVSLAQAYVYKEAWPRAIIAGDAIVGFLMLSIEREESDQSALPKISVWRLLIGAQFQGLGYGAAAMGAAIAFAKAEGAPCLSLSCVPGENGPKAFYRASGFEPTGEVDDDGEVILSMPL